MRTTIFLMVMSALPGNISDEKAVIPEKLVSRPPLHYGLVTVFNISSKDSGNPDDRLACEKGRRLEEREFVVASYALPCGTEVRLYNPATDTVVVAVVRDRGPVRTKRNPALLDTDLDLTQSAASALGVPNGGKLLWWVSTGDPDEQPSIVDPSDPKPLFKLARPRRVIREPRRTS